MANKCPKCSSDQWKSARLVIAEGTTNSTSNLKGNITEKGSLSANPRDWYLADRWFSYDNPIEAEINTTSSSLIVDQVKQLMVSAAEGRMLPSPPLEPSQIIYRPAPIKRTVSKPDWFKSDPAGKTPPTEPPKPNSPLNNLDPFNEKSWLQNYFEKLISSFIWIAILLGIFSYFSPSFIRTWGDVLIKSLQFSPSEHERFILVEPIFEVSVPRFSELMQSLALSNYLYNLLGTVLLLLAIFSIRALIIFPGSFSIENKRKQKYSKVVEKAEEEYAKRLEKYEEQMRAHKAALKKREDESQVYKERQEKYQTELKIGEIEYQKALEEHKKQLKEEQEILETKKKNYLVAYNEYEAEVAQVRAFRNELWERARMCTRCGETYLGDKNLP